MTTNIYPKHGMTQTALSFSVGLSESHGRRLIKIFNDYIPCKYIGDTRYFIEESVHKLQLIKNIKELGYSNTEVKQFLDENENLTLDTIPQRRSSNLWTQTAISNEVGWSESTGRSWIKFLDDYIPYKIFDGAKYFDEKALNKVRIVKELNDKGYTKSKVKDILDGHKDFSLNDAKNFPAARTSFSSKYAEVIENEMPSRKDLMLGILYILRDKKPYKTTEMIDLVAAHFNVSPELQSIKDESDKGYIFVNRIRAARYSLKTNDYIVETAKFTYQITDAGLSLLDEDVDDIEEEIDELDTFIDPIDVIEEKVKQIENDLVNELINLLQTMHWRRLEVIVVELLTTMGYGDGEVTQKTNDGGFDGIMSEDELGFDKVYIQAKRYKNKNSVSLSEVMAFSGALDGKSALKGVFITTSRFTKSAVEYAQKLETKKIRLIDGEKLARLLIRYNIGIGIKKKIIIKEVELDFFEGEE